MPLTEACQCLWASRPLAQIVIMHFWIILQSALTSAGSDQPKIQPLLFIAEPSDVVALRDKPLLLNCSTTGHPEAAVHWRRDGIPVNLDSRRSVLSNGSLFFTKIVHSRTDRPDEGVYQCSVTNSVGTIVSRPGKVQIAALPPFEDEPQNQRRIEGQTARFSCHVPAIPLPTTTWYKDESLLMLDGRMLILPSGALEIGSVRAADAGSYKCKVENVDGSRFSSSGRLSVDTDPDPESELQAPVFSMRARLVTLSRGGKAVLECAAYGYPTPTLSWLKNGSPVGTKNSRSMVTGTGNLQIENVQPDDAGQYKCRAENSADSIDTVIVLEVHEFPVFIKRPIDTYGRKDSDVLLECEIRGTPEPTIQWYKDGDMVIPSDYFQIDNGKNLRILGLVKSDGGVYQCFGSNTAGTTQTAAQLLVLDVDARAPALHNMPPSRVGGAAPLTNIPSAPRAIVTHLVSSRFVTLTWQAPTVTNTPLLTYSVYYKQAGSTRERVFNTSANHKEANIQGLRPDTNYAFRVVAYNQHGPGESSEEISIHTHPEVDVPGPASNFRVYPLSTTEIKLEWDAPQYASGAIQKYRLTYRESGSASQQELDTEKRQYILTSLRPYIEYAVWVVAFSENGPGTSTTQLTARTYSDVPTAPPENVQIEPTSANSLTIRWEPPPSDAQNGPIISYKIRFRNKSTKKADVVSVEGNRRVHTISSLERGQTYLLRIAAATINGTGPPTEWLSGETFRDDLDELKEPGQPAALRARPTAKSVVINWSPPNDGNVVVRGYTIGWGIGIPDVYTKIVDSKERVYSIEELEPGSEYVISVRAFNNMGDGRPIYETVTTRLPSAPVDAQAAILPPVGLQAQVISDRTVLVRWTDSSLPSEQLPTDNRIYTVRYSSLRHTSQKPHTVESTDLEVPIDGLSPNTQYMFEVKVAKGRTQSTWSLSVVNRTHEAVPSTPPMDLTAVPVPNNPTAVMINYAPPENPNGLVTGYLVFFTADNTQNDRDWAVEGVVGDKLTTVIRNLYPSTKYFFKIQARNSKGYSPLSPVVTFTTPAGDPSRVATQDAFGMPLNTLYIIIAVVVSVFLIVSVILTIVCYWRKCKSCGPGRKGSAGYKAGSKKGKYGGNQPDLQPPDLWLHHQQDNLELKHVEKSPHEIVPILKHSNEYTNNINLSATLDRLQKRTNSFVDIKNNIDGRSYNDMNKFNSLSRRSQRPLMIPLDQHPPREPIGSVIPLANNASRHPVQVPDTMQRNIFPRTTQQQQPSLSIVGHRLPTIESSPHQSLASPDPSTPSTTAGYDTASSGAQVVSGSDTLRSGSHRLQAPHPLKSFSVPAPPPQVNGTIPSITTPRHLVTKSPQQTVVPPNAHHLPSNLTNGSPYKRAPMTVSIQNQPRSPKPPVTFAELPKKDDGRPLRAGASTDELPNKDTFDGLLHELDVLQSGFNC